MAEQQVSQDLTVKGESIERIYGNFLSKKYLVNRRYQRKLVWTLEEKRNFIDSIAKGYPVPIVLLAEVSFDQRNLFEIIDGMQRLNAVMSFIENEYSIVGGYFDLNTMAETKHLLDTQKLVQKEPTLPREACVAIASYTMPLSIYESSQEEEIDEVFRRINSGGRKLSRQELRIAGSTGHFAEAVRKIASRIRGDVSSGDTLLLNEMNRISIGSKELPYGLNVDEIFWIQNGILTKEQTRESRDEELVADLLAYVLLTPKPPSRSEFLDEYFALGDSEPAQLRYNGIETAVQKNTVEVLESDFQRTLDSIKFILSQSGKTFGQLLFEEEPARAPRYFQAVFLAFYTLIINENQEISDSPLLIKSMFGMSKHISVPEGGRWGAADREKAVSAAKGVVLPAFKPATTYDPAKVRWITQLENLLVQSYTEQAAYDFKQGFLRLDGSNQFDDASFDKILRTLVGIANIKKGTKGYVLVGIADNSKDAQRVKTLFGVQVRSYESFVVTGIDHEAKALGKTLDQYFQTITEKVRGSDISEPLREYVARNLKLVRYYDRSVLVFEADAQEEPSRYGQGFFVRLGNNLAEISPDKFADLFRRFQRGQ